MRVLPIIAFFCFSLILHADPVEIENSTSPNGDFYIAINPAPNDFEKGVGVLQVINVKDKSVVGSFDWRQVDAHIKPDSARILWKPDNRAFAITWYMAAGWTGSAVYAEYGTDWVLLPLPKFKKTYIGHSGWIGKGTGQFTAVEWVDDDVLKMRFEEGLEWSSEVAKPDIGVLDENDWVYLKLSRPGTGPKFDLQKVETIPGNAPKTGT